MTAIRARNQALKAPPAVRGGGRTIDHDVLELIKDFQDSAPTRGLQVELRNFPPIKFDLLSAITHKAAPWTDTKDS